MTRRLLNIPVYTILRLDSVIYWHRVLLLAILLMALAATGVQAQHDSKGKAFWITFMACAGSRDGELTDMRIYLGCDRPASATITYGLTGRTITVSLPTPNKP